MKNSLITFILFIFILVRTNAQNLTIVYEAYTIQSQEMLEKIPAYSEYNSRYYYSLNIHKNISKFSRDSVLVISLPNINFKELWEFEEIYKDYNKDSWISHSGRYKEGYGLEKVISEMAENNKFQWQISQDKQLIAGIECIKALSPKGYTAWFAPKLPYPDGPQYGIFNLPGLVLSLETPNSKWVANQVIVKNNDNDIDIPKLTLVQSETEIKLSYKEIKALGTEKVITIDKDTPIGKRLTFKK